MSLKKTGFQCICCKQMTARLTPVEGRAILICELCNKDDRRRAESVKRYDELANGDVIK